MSHLDVGVVVLVLVALFLAAAVMILARAARKEGAVLTAVLEVRTHIRDLKAQVTTVAARLDEVLIELRRR